MMFIKVDLPEPDWPMMATNSPLMDFQRYAVEGANDGIAVLIMFLDGR